MTQEENSLSGKTKNKGLIAELSVLFNTRLREALYPNREKIVVTQSEWQTVSYNSDKLLDTKNIQNLSAPIY